MKDLLLQYANYSYWANQQIGDTIIQLPKEKQYQEVLSSFNSLYKTILHVWDSESIWWQRLKLQERILIPSEGFKGDFSEAVSNLLNQNRQWKEWLMNAQEHMLDHVFQYKNSKQQQFKQPVYEMILHVFNHGTYHRGQLVTILHELGITKIPPTDFILWSRKAMGR